MNIVFFTLFFLTGCNGITSEKSDEKEALPSINIPFEDYNKYFQVIPFRYVVNSNKNGEYMVYKIINPTNQTFIFPYDYGIKIFEKKKDGWESIDNLFGYGETDTKFQLVPQEQYAAGLVIRLVPYISDLQDPTTIRIVVVGYYESDPSKLVGAYIDTTLRP